MLVAPLHADARGELISVFETRSDLIETLCTSAHIPFYSDGSAARKYRGTWYYDGGITNFLPAPPEVDYTARVCCFPSQSLNLVRSQRSDPCNDQLTSILSQTSKEKCTDRCCICCLNAHQPLHGMLGSTVAPTVWLPVVTNVIDDED
jgi:predicted acylesterase/phospholipase RssA